MSRYDPAVLDLAGLLAYWPLDERYPDGRDISGNDYHLAGAGGVTVGGHAAGPDAIRNATDFDGTDDRVQTTADHPDGRIFAAGTQRTIELWAAADDFGANAALCGARGSSATFLRVTTARAVQFDFDSGGGAAAASWAAAWPDTTGWVHCVLTIDEPADTLELFINGVSQGTKAHADAYNASASGFTVGARGSATDPFDGKISRVAVYDGLLAAATIARLYALGLPAAPAVVAEPAQLRVVTLPPTGGRGWDLTDPAEGLSWSNINPGGDEQSQFTVKRNWAQGAPEIALGHILRVEDGLDVLFQGRVEENDRQVENSERIGVTAYGLGIRLKDDKFREIYADRDLTRWGEASRARRIDLLNAGYAYQGGPSVVPDPTNGAPAIRLGWSGVWADQQDTEALYDAEAELIASIYYEWERGALTDSTDTDFSWVIGAADDDELSAGNEESANLRASGPGSGTFTPSAAKRFAHLRFRHDELASAGIDGREISLFWNDLTVYGGHSLTKRGSDPGGFYVSDLVRDVAGRAAGIRVRRIDSMEFIVPHCLFRDPAMHEDAVAEINKYAAYNWGTWGPDSALDPSTDGHFDFTARTNDAHWLARRADCDDIQLHVELSTLFNVVDVVYTDPTGVTRTETRTAVVPALQEMGFNTTDRPKKPPAPVNAGLTTQTGAQQIGDTYLALSGSRAPARGSATFSGRIRHTHRGRIGAHRMRADGSNFRLEDVLPSSDALSLAVTPDRLTAYPIKRIRVDASGKAPKTSAEVDQSNDLLSVLLSRQQITTQAAVGSF